MEEIAMTPSAIREEIGACIRRYRLIAGFSQRDIAQKMNVSSALVSMWEHGTVKIYADTVNDLAKILGINPSALYGKYAEVKTPAVDPDSERIEEIIRLFRSLSPEQKDSFLAFLRSFAVP